MSCRHDNYEKELEDGAEADKVNVCAERDLLVEGIRIAAKYQRDTFGAYKTANRLDKFADEFKESYVV